MGLENICLVSCRSPFLDDDKIYPPLANLYLHQKMLNERPGVKVTVTDDYDLEDPTWLKDFDAVGISIMTPQREEAVRVMRFVKKHRPDTKVIAGGPHPKYYHDSMTDEGWDHIVADDGERAILDIIDGSAPFLSRDIIHPRDFANLVVKPARLENKAFLGEFNYKLNGRDSTTMLTARGCPEHCTFCEDAHSFVKYTPFDLVVEELDDIQEMGYEGVYIFDDIFSLIIKRTEPIAKELKRRDLIYRCNGQARLFTEEFADLLAETGCYEVAFGAESGHQKILDNIEKRTTVEQNYNFVRWCKARGIICKAFLMLGLPGEDLETIKATEQFIATSGLDDFQLAIYYPYRGTQIRDEIEAGRDDFDLKFEGEGLGAYGQKGGYSEAVVRTKALTREDLLAHRDRILKTYRPESHKTAWNPQDDMFFDTHLVNSTDRQINETQGYIGLTVKGEKK